MPQNAEIRLKKNLWLSLSKKHFEHSTDGKTADQETIVELKYDENFLFIKFECKNNPFWNQNGYTEHNSDMWNQEVFELFISNEIESTKHYLEFEINPNNAIWVGRIHNPTGLGHIHEDTEFITHEETNIKHLASGKGDSWSGSFQIPFGLIGKKQSEYRLNFYRIISKKSHENKSWIGSPDDCDYTCWQSTMSGTEPAFHRSKAFGKLILD